MSVMRVEAVPVLGYVERDAFAADREARLLGLLPLPVSIPPELVSTNYKGDHALLDPFDEPWHFSARPTPL